MTLALRAIPYAIHCPARRFINRFLRVRVHYTRKTAAKLLLFFDMTKFFLHFFEIFHQFLGIWETQREPVVL